MCSDSNHANRSAASGFHGLSGAAITSLKYSSGLRRFSTRPNAAAPAVPDANMPNSKLAWIAASVGGRTSANGIRARARSYGSGNALDQARVRLSPRLVPSNCPSAGPNAYDRLTNASNLGTLVKPRYGLNSWDPNRFAERLVPLLVNLRDQRGISDADLFLAFMIEQYPNLFHAEDPYAAAELTDPTRCVVDCFPSTIISAKTTPSLRANITNPDLSR